MLSRDLTLASRKQPTKTPARRLVSGCTVISSRSNNLSRKSCKACYWSRHKGHNFIDKNIEQKVCKSSLLSFYYTNHMSCICHGVHVRRSIPFQHCGLSVGKGFCAYKLVF